MTFLFFQSAVGGLRQDAFLIAVCVRSSSCSLPRMTWISLACVPPLNRPGLQQQPRPDSVSAYSPVSTPTHLTRSSHSQVRSRCLFETPTSEPFLQTVPSECVHTCKLEHGRANHGAKGGAALLHTQTHTHTECELVGPEG